MTMETQTKKICQSCSMALDDESECGSNCDGTTCDDYCKYCYKDGEFVAPETTLLEMVLQTVPYTMETTGLSESQAQSYLEALLPTLKRWKTA